VDIPGIVIIAFILKKLLSEEVSGFTSDRRSVPGKALPEYDPEGT